MSNPNPLPAAARVAASTFATSIVLLASAPPSHAQAQADFPPATEVVPNAARVERLEQLVGMLASDDFEGRRTGTPGAARAAHYIAAKLDEFGITAAGNDRYFQRIPMRRIMLPDGSQRLEPLSDWGAYNAIPAEQRLIESNVVGMIRGSDARLRDEAVIVAAHYDHLGIGATVDGDSVFNGADDDASGVAAMLEIARALAEGPAPRRSVIFLATTGEEMGMLGTQWYLRNPVVPLRRTVAVLAIEMIGQPDSLAGGPGYAWLTGHSRSTLGEILSRYGLPIVPDPRPEYDFFTRSDNIPFAYRGIPAHTLSSYNMHTHYHTTEDEVERIDFEHMAQVTESAIDAVRLLADGETPRWRPGGRPVPRRY